MTGPAFQLSSVSKRYGATEAVRSVSLSAARGECVALLGHNGAGKTTLIKLMLGLTDRDSGSVSVLGADPRTHAAIAIRGRIGFLPENVAFHGTMTGREVLAFYARLKGVALAECEPLLDRVGLVEAGAHRLKTYSKGMRQRLGLAQALLGQPQLMVLDEPTTGLDPLLRRRFYEIVRELREGGTTVVLSSHMLTELEARTDRAVILRNGRVVADGGLSELRRAAGLPAHVHIRVAQGPPADVVARVGGAELMQVNGRTASFTCPIDQKIPVLRRLADPALAVEDFDIELPTLEEVYAHFSEREDSPCGPS